MYRSALARSSATLVARPFSTSPAARKTATEKVAEAADKLNKNLGKGLASAIETGEQATQKTKEAVMDAKEDLANKSNQATDKAGQTANQAKNMAGSTVDQVKDMADQTAHNASAPKEQTKGAAKK